MIKNKNGLFGLFWLIIIFLIVGFFIFIKFVSGATVHEKLEDIIYEERVRVIITLKQEVPKSFSDNFFLTKSEPKKHKPTQNHRKLSGVKNIIKNRMQMTKSPLQN